MQENPEGPVVDLGWIFDGPIEAVIRANMMAAGEFVEFLQRYGFDGPSDDPAQMFGELRMLSFSFEQPDASGLPVKRIFRVPWLSIVPLPLLEVKDGTFKFGVRVLAAVPVRDSSRGMRLLKAGDPDEPDPPPLKWRAMLASNRPRRRDDKDPDLTPHLAANLHAKVTVRQADIPAGISNLLALMGQNAQVTPILLTAQPPALRILHAALDRGAGERPAAHRITLTTLSDAWGADDPTRITAFYDDQLLRLFTEDEDDLRPWPSGTSMRTYAKGRLLAYVFANVETPARATAVPILFRTQVEGASAVAEVSCSFLTPMLAGAP